MLLLEGKVQIIFLFYFLKFQNYALFIIKQF